MKHLETWGVNDYNFSDYFPVRFKKRLELGLEIDDFVLISVGRLDINKNNETIIRALAKVPNVKLFLCGERALKDSLIALAKSLGVLDRVFFLGNRSDIMEAMANGLPCIVSKIRGNVD